MKTSIALLLLAGTLAAAAPASAEVIVRKTVVRDRPHFMHRAPPRFAHRTVVVKKVYR